MKKSLILCALVLVAIGCHRHHTGGSSTSTSGCISNIISSQKGDYKDWKKCKYSSNWTGANASQRLMNILSPKMDDGTFNARVNFIKSRKCDTVHLILANKADGEKAGYSIYGSKFDFNIDQNYSKVMLDRVKKLAKDYYVVLWLITDDSNDWARTLASNPKKYVEDLDKLGFFKYASIVVTGLEANEYWNASQCINIYSAVKSKYKGKVGIHQTSGSTSLVGASDVFFGQLNPGSSKAQIQNFTKKCLGYGKPVCMFELERQENRQKSQWALDAGAFAIGNW